MRSKFMAAFVIVCGLLLGSLVGELCKNAPSFISWLSHSKEIGLSVSDPLFLDLVFIKLRFGLSLNLSVASVLFIFIALFIYKKLS